MKLKFGPVSRISMGLVSLAAFLLLTADLLLGLMPDQTDIARQVRKRSAESLAVQLAALVQQDQFEVLRRTLHAVISRDNDVLSIAVRRSDGEVMAETGNHAKHWSAPSGAKSTLTNVVVPISSSQGVWGQIEVAYRPIMPRSLLEWLKYPGVGLTLLMLTLGFLLFYLYLRRILQRLDPSAAIPDRVRTAFDALTEGVLVIDKQGHVLLANNVFRAMHPGAAIELTGKRIKDLGWLIAAVGQDPEQYPWARAMREAAQITGETIRIPRDSGEPLKTVINCSPIQDDKGGVRGCLITFDDLSMVEHMNQALLDSVAQLEVAKRQIEQQNEELKRLADHDQLTGTLTRRAFLEQAQHHFLRVLAQRGELSCLMGDIDHFKAINDRYGHLVGDQAIEHVARTLGASLRPGDLVCRYGGEEFCLLLPGLGATAAHELAERMRTRIEATCGAAVIPGENVRITISFGVAAVAFGGSTLAELIKQADQALYLAKNAGRNRVARYDEALQLAGGRVAA
jgi:diguanylate cyclase (GGDEF)-like protein/PAS domain S-box-containing protein